MIIVSTPEELDRARRARTLLNDKRRAISGKRGRELGAALVEVQLAARAFDEIPRHVLTELDARPRALRYADETDYLNPKGADRLRRWVGAAP